MASRTADWEPKYAAATRAVADLGAPEIARIDEEEGHLGERMSGLWGQRETHQRWASEHPEASLRLDHLTREIDSLNRSLGDDSLRPDRTRSFDERLALMVSTAPDRNLGIDLGL